MSRHKIVKALDLDAELDDYDGGEDYDDYEDGYTDQLSAEDKEQLQHGIVKVRHILSPEVRVSDQDIEDALWHYYYDVEKSVNYLLNQKTESTPKEARSQKNASKWQPVSAISEFSSKAAMDTDRCNVRHPASGFFHDCPWLNIPEERRGEILVERPHHHGGLLGGASSQGDGKPSKLAALAAARRKRGNENQPGNSANSSVAILDKLGVQSSPLAAIRPSRTSNEESTNTKENPAPTQDAQTRTMTQGIRDLSIEERSELVETDTDSPKPAEPEAKEDVEPVVSRAALPSAFAQTLFGFSPIPRQETDERHSLKRSLPSSEPATFPLLSYEMTNADIAAFAEPSPDDIVLKAQNSKGSKAAKLDKTKTVNDITKGVEKVVVNDVPKPKSKNLDVIAEFEKTKQKPAANFVVIGHVDAGKSTLMGRLLYDLEVVDRRTLDKYRREAESIGKSSFALAWVLDQGTDERNAGVTIDIGMNKFETEKTAFTILDAPGHRDFIPNMIAGASQADFAVLVIDASTGSFESGLKGQTKEHALLVRSMGVQRIIVAVNKLDTLSWSKDRFKEIQQQVSAFLTTAGFQPKNLAFLPCSGLTGDNVVRKATEPKASWYTGPPLITLLESSEPFTRAHEKPLRMTIDDIFRGGVQNPLSVSGRLDAGSIQVGDVITVTPSSETASIKGIEIHSEPTDWAVAGQNVVLHLADIDQKYLKTGDILCPPSAPIQPIKSFTMKILAFEHILPMAVEVHRGRLHAPGKVTKLVAVLDKSTGQPVEGAKKKVKIVKPGNVARVVVEVDEAVPLEVGGRVVLRSGGETVGAGLLE